MRYFDIARKTASILANLSLFLNSFLPFALAIQPVHAQSADDVTPIPTEIIINSEPVESTPISTPTITETPTIEPTTAPTPEIIPQITPEASSTAEVTPNITPTGTPPVLTTPEPENNSSDNNQPNVLGSSSLDPAITEAPVQTPTPTPTSTSSIEQICLTDTDIIRDSVEIDWNYNSTEDLYETREKVQLGIKYIFPQENNVTVTFKCLPKDESLRTNLKIKRVKTSDLKLPNSTNVGEYAYDITTGMFDGQFKYDITLPKTSDSTAEVSYVEKTLDQAKENIFTDEIKSIENLEQQTDSVKASNVDHFTIFFVSATLSTATLNNQSQVMVYPNDTIKVTLNVDLNELSGWKFSSWRIDDGSWNDVNTKDHLNLIAWSTDHFSENFNITAPSIIGTYDVSFRVCPLISFNDCKFITLTDGITVQPLCGNGKINPSEQCDDGNKITNDGCSDSCKIEKGWNCSGEPSSCADNGKKITICHASGQTGTTKFETLTLSENAVYSPGNGGHFNENGTPKAGHEDDYLGACTAEDLCGNDILDSGEQCDGTINVSVGYSCSNSCTLIRDTGTITINKVINPSADNGKFSLKIGETVYKANAGNGDSTGVIILPTGLYTVSEESGTNTSLSSYTTSLDCIDQQTSQTVIDGPKNGVTSIQNIELIKGQNIICTFTNTRYASVSGYKYADQDGSLTTSGDQDPVSGWEMKLFKFDGANYIDTGRTATTDSNGYYIFNNLSADAYRVIEESKNGWTPLSPPSPNLEQINISLASGQESVNNNFINSDDDKLTICHATGSESNSFNKVTISKSAVYHAHIQHQDIEDIIPVFTYNNIEYSQNWTDNEYNQAVYENDCNPDVLSSISGQKFLDYDGDGEKDFSESGIQGWTINLDENADGIIDHTTVTDASGNYTFSELDAGTYRITEENQSGWYQTTTNPSDIILGYKDEVENINFGNFQKGSVMGCKYDDLNGSGVRSNKNTWEGISEPQMSGWIIRLYDSDWQKVGEDVTDPYFYFNNIMTAGTYYLCEQMQPGWTQTEPLSGENYGYTAVQNQSGDPTEGSLCKQVDVSQSGFNGSHYYSFGNQRLEPKATISKSNNSGGVELSPGNSVEYTIDIAFQDNNVSNLKVTDLLSNGFKYRLGSYKVFRNGSDVTDQIEEPQYHSPGVWDLSSLEELTPEDEIKLVYIADISTDQQAGKYADLAFASANYAYDLEESLLATAQDDGYIDTNFVGTQVAVGGNYQNSVSAEVQQTNKVTGQVLGASTELPGTGAATIWLFISAILGTLGFTLIKSGKITKSMAKKLFLIPILTILALASLTGNVLAQSSNLVIRLEEPKTPAKTKEIELKFVALDTQGRGVSVICLKKGPSDSSFVQFGSTINLDGVSGNSSHCLLNQAISEVGSYQLQVKAIAGGEQSLSNIVSLDYQTSVPGTPIDYRKEQINNCDFKIHFKTADDHGKTIKVELYRSTDSNFSANNESLVSSVNIGSNQEKDIFSNVSDCSKTYYFALRAFDNAGNGSGLVGDKVYSTITEGVTITSTSTIPTSGAIPVTGNIIPNEEIKNSENTTTPSAENNGQVLGVGNKDSQSFFARYKIISIIIVAVALAIIAYAFKKITQSKKRGSKKR